MNLFKNNNWLRTLIFSSGALLANPALAQETCKVPDEASDIEDLILQNQCELRAQITSLATEVSNIKSQDKLSGYAVAANWTIDPVTGSTYPSLAETTAAITPGLEAIFPQISAPLPPEIASGQALIELFQNSCAEGNCNVLATPPQDANAAITYRPLEGAETQNYIENLINNRPDAIIYSNGRLGLLDPANLVPLITFGSE